MDRFLRFIREWLDTLSAIGYGLILYIGTTVALICIMSLYPDPLDGIKAIFCGMLFTTAVVAYFNSK